MVSELLGKNENLASDELLAALRDRHTYHGEPGHKVAVYQNHDLNSASIGHFIFLIIGPGRTIVEAPDRAPDGAYGLGWRYLHIGYLDLDTNQLEKKDG